MYSDELSLEMDESLFDFTKCKIDLGTMYGGSEKKRGIYLNGKRYMLKLADKIDENKRNELNSSYSNSVISEYVSCTILKALGFSVQNVILGKITLTSSKGYKRIYPAVACENFVPNDKSFIEFKTIENTLLSIKPSKTPDIASLYDIMLGNNVYFSKEFGKIALNSYWDMFILDALLGNFDRHSGNWGYFVDENERISLAPIYDCGSCLYPQISDDGIKLILENQDEIDKRILVFPKAALTVNGEKVKYRDYIASGSNFDCTKALLRILPRLDFSLINSVIDNTPSISGVRKEFYKIMIARRYELILQYSYDKLKVKCMNAF